LRLPPRSRKRTSLKPAASTAGARMGSRFASAVRMAFFLPDNGFQAGPPDQNPFAAAALFGTATQQFSVVWDGRYLRRGAGKFNRAFGFPSRLRRRRTNEAWLAAPFFRRRR